MANHSKPLDMTAWILVGIGILGIAGSVLSRSHFNDAALKKDIHALSYADDKVWIGLDKELISLDAANKIQRIPLESLGIRNDTIRQVVSSNGLFVLNSLNGNTYTCTDMRSICPQTSTRAEKNSYNNLIALPNDTYLTVNNFSANIVSHNFGTGTRIKEEQYDIPELDDDDMKHNVVIAKMGEMDGFSPNRLYRPNSGYVIDNHYIQSDTGNYRVVSWPLENGKPNFKAPKVITHTDDQPYNIGLIKGKGINAVDKLVVLEGPQILVDGELVTYDVNAATPEDTRSEIPLPLKDPTLLAQAGNQIIYVMAAKTGKLAKVEFLSTSFTPTLTQLRHPELNAVLKENFASKSRYELLSKLACGLFLLPIIMLLLLVKMGYNLNQKL